MKKRADGRYQKGVTIRQPDGSTKVVVVYGKTQTELYRKAAALNRRSLKGATFEEVADEWLETRADEYSPNTINRSYINHQKRAIREFGDIQIRDITAPRLSGFIKDLASGFSDSTVRIQLAVLTDIFQYAMEIGEIEFNPAKAVHVPRNLEKKKISSPDPETIQGIIRNVDAPFGFFPFLALHTGMRRGELLALEWKDFHDGVITVDKALYWEYNKGKIKRPKTAAGYRTVPILPAVEPYIKKRGLVFKGKDGGYLSEAEFIYSFDKYRKATGLSFTAHQLRHAFATTLFEHDIAPKDAQQILGHANISTLLDIYTDVTEARKKQVFEKVKSVIF